jgi:hypothetical protein
MEPGETPISSPINRHGHVVNTKVKAVCKTCNNGWMSIAETEAKSPLIQLMHRQTHSISPKDQLAIARWVMIKMFVMEWSKPHIPAFTQETRTAFYEQRTMPDDLFIDLLAFDGGETWAAAFVRQSLWIGDKEQAAILDGSGLELCNTQSVTFGIGYLTVHVFHSYALAVEPAGHPNISRRIWPPSGSYQPWPPVQIMTSDELHTASLAFNAYLATKGGKVPFLPPRSP